MISAGSPLLLGSASPRRRDILTGLRIPIRVLPADVVEDVLDGEEPEAYLARIVDAKLRAVAQRAREVRGVRGTDELPPSTPARASESRTLEYGAVLVADTSVILGREILGKPRDRADSERLLAELCGRTHVVYTRYAIASGREPEQALVSRSVTSRVTMRAASEDERRGYAATGEGDDKAGAYAVQGLGAFLVERIDGSYSNVVGLPACEVVQDLVALGLLQHFP